MTIRSNRGAVALVAALLFVSAACGGSDGSEADAALPDAASLDASDGDGSTQDTGTGDAHLGDAETNSDAATDGGPGADASTVPCDHVRLAWDAPNTTVSGSCATDLAGFKVYYGARSGGYTDVVNLDLGNPELSCAPNGNTNNCGPIETCTHEVQDLPAATWHFSVTAFQTSGAESGYANEVSTTISCGPALPSCPDQGGAITNELGFYSGGNPTQWIYDGYAYRSDGSARYTLVMVASGAWNSGTYAFTDDEASEATCRFCVKIFRGKVVFMPRAGGTFTFTRLDPAVGGHFAGSLSEVVLQEVTIDPTTQATTPVVGGLTECLSSFSWDVVME